MKYIRTENGIYKVTATAETNKIYEYGNCYQIYDHNNCIRKDILIKDIIKQADTIEELCDELVIAYKDCYEKRTYLYSRTIQEFKENRTNYKSKFFTYYGAIWTNKGLIYVAKMNEKGELELI